MNRLPALSSYKARFQSAAKQSGITLLELLIVIAVFSIMSAAAYSGLQNSLKTEENFNASMKDLEAVQMSLALFQRDIMQLSPRAVRDAFGDKEAAIVLFNGRELIFTRGGNFSSLKLDQSRADTGLLFFAGRTIYSLILAPPGQHTRRPAVNRIPFKQSNQSANTRSRSE